ncbi:MAG: phosphate signaling complex protein PhoU [Candidatus Micrarchaeota archaeon]
MVRDRYHEVLDSVKYDLEELCELVCNALDLSVEYLEGWDKEGEGNVIKEDRYINKAFIDLQEKCFRLIARQQPVAGDLRFLGSALVVGSNLERAGDYAADIAKTVKLLKPRIMIGVKDIKKMNKSASEALRLSVESFVERDTEVIKRVLLLEKMNDAQFKSLLEKIKKTDKHCKNHEVLFRTVMIGRHLERFADRAVNITHRTNYLVTGEREYLK